MDAALYATYKQRVKEFSKAKLARVSFVEATERLCLSGTLQLGMTAVSTTFVCVMQDDLAFIKPVDVLAIIATLMTPGTRVRTHARARAR